MIKSRATQYRIWKSRTGIRYRKIYYVKLVRAYMLSGTASKQVAEIMSILFPSKQDKIRTCPSWIKQGVERRERSESSSLVENLSEEELKLSYELAQASKEEFLVNGKVETVCPKCKQHPVVKITGIYDERVTVFCECGFVSCREYGI